MSSREGGEPWLVWQENDLETRSLCIKEASCHTLNGSPPSRGRQVHCSLYFTTASHGRGSVLLHIRDKLMEHKLIVHIFIFLASASIMVPVASRFKLGSVIGYLVVGMLIGPFGLGLIGNPSKSCILLNLA